MRAFRPSDYGEPPVLANPCIARYDEIVLTIERKWGRVKQGKTTKCRFPGCTNKQLMKKRPDRKKATHRPWCSAHAKQLQRGGAEDMRPIGSRISGVWRIDR